MSQSFSLSSLFSPFQNLSLGNGSAWSFAKRGKANDLPQELVDHIVGFIPNSPTALRSCTLVNSAWSAQSSRSLLARVRVPSGRVAEFAAEVTKPGSRVAAHVRQLRVTQAQEGRIDLALLVPAVFDCIPQLGRFAVEGAMYSDNTLQLPQAEVMRHIHFDGDVELIAIEPESTGAFLRHFSRIRTLHLRDSGSPSVASVTELMENQWKKQWLEHLNVSAIKVQGTVWVLCFLAPLLDPLSVEELEVILETEQTEGSLQVINSLLRKAVKNSLKTLRLLRFYRSPAHLASISKDCLSALAGCSVLESIELWFYSPPGFHFIVSHILTHLPPSVLDIRIIIDRQGAQSFGARTLDSDESWPEFERCLARCPNVRSVLFLDESGWPWCNVTEERVRDKFSERYRKLVSVE